MLVEFLDGRRRQRALAPDAPFAFEELRRSGALICAKRLSDLGGAPPSPAVVLASHPSLRLGEAPALLMQWRSQRASLLLLTAPCDD
eukprot:6375660-Prymnesium_polylepis.1